MRLITMEYVLKCPHVEDKVDFQANESSGAWSMQVDASVIKELVA